MAQQIRRDPYEIAIEDDAACEGEPCDVSVMQPQAKVSALARDEEAPRSNEDGCGPSGHARHRTPTTAYDRA